MSSLVSFCAPCFQFKVVGGIKNQFGFAGFTTDGTRYLNRSVSYSEADDSITTPANGRTGASGDSIDRATGTITTSGEVGIRGIDDYLYDRVDIGYEPAGVYVIDDYTKRTVTIASDTSMTKLYEWDIFGGISNKYTAVITLSSPYSRTDVESDCDGIIASVDVGAMPWNSIQYGAGNEGSSSFGIRNYDTDKFKGFPGGVTYSNAVPVGSSTSESPMQGIAWTWWMPANGGDGNGSLVKAVGYIKMLGNYKVQTYPVTWSGATPSYGSATCANGNTTCGSTIATINPPASDPDTNYYLKVVPGGRC